MDKKNSEQMFEKARSLMERAYYHLDQYEPGKARKLGKELVDMGYSGGYEILALCFDQEEKFEKALDILKEGTKRMPQAWPLWQQLGNRYSDLEKYELAHDCYRNAINCSGADQAAINLDRALALYREGSYLEALEMLEALPTDWTNRSAPLKASVLNGLQHFDKTIDLCRQMTDQALSSLDQTELTRHHICVLFTEMALAMRAKGRDADALASIKTALGWGTDSFTLQTYRELNNQVSKQAKHYSLTVKGKWSEPFEGEDQIPEFLRVFQVIADSPEEALSFAKDLEPSEITDSLTIDRWEELEEQPNSLKGVYQALGHIYFGKE